MNNTEIPFATEEKIANFADASHKDLGKILKVLIKYR